MKERKVHVLEGTDAGGAKWLGCGKRASKETPTVGCVVIADGKEHEKISCAHCRRLYRLDLEAAS